jgi:predicted ATP-dependent protease
VGKPQVAQQVEHDGGAVLARLRERQAGHGAHLQLELRDVAGVLAVVAAVVRARGDLVDHQAAVLQHEELHAQHAHVMRGLLLQILQHATA